MRVEREDTPFPAGRGKSPALLSGAYRNAQRPFFFLSRTVFGWYNISMKIAVFFYLGVRRKVKKDV